MKEENKTKTNEKDQKIVILDRGIVTANDPGPRFACCGATFFPLRW